MCMIEDYDGNQFWSERFVRKAKKEHRCAECRRVIGAGEGYWHQSGKGDDFFSYKACAHCREAQQALMKECNGFMHEHVLEDLEEHRTLPMARLAVGIRRKWQRFHGGLMRVPSERSDAGVAA